MALLPMQSALAENIEKGRPIFNYSMNLSATFDLLRLQRSTILVKGIRQIGSVLGPIPFALYYPDQSKKLQPLVGIC